VRARDNHTVAKQPRMLRSRQSMSSGLVLAGRYRLTSQLGQGGMGSVWRAEDLHLGAEIAIKLIDPAYANSDEALKRFQREAQAAAMIRSTYVVQILDHGVDNGTPYIAMELLRGESLAQRLESVGKLSPEAVGRIFGHVGRALELAHEHGIVHRDMKPENIFLVREGEDDVGKVLDFGIARQAGGLMDSGGLKTQTGAILGTPYYMSPEQATGQAVDYLTDIWSFGIIACECLTGRRAFDCDSLGGLFHAICMAPLPVPSQLGEVPMGFDDWFARAAARDKPARFQSIREATAELRARCGRQSGRPSAASYSSAARNVDAALLGKSASAEAAVAVATGLQTTAVPSSRSVAGLTQPRRTAPNVVVLAVTVLITGLVVVGWRAMRTNTRTASSAASSVASAPVAAAQSVALSGSPPIQPAPNRVEERIDAGLNAAGPVEHNVETPSPAPGAFKHPSPVRPVRPVRPAKAPKPAVPAAAPVKPAAPQPQPASGATKPAAEPRKSDDNAAGI